MGDVETPRRPSLSDWCQNHPKSMGYLLVMTTLNFVVSILNAAGVT